MVAAPHVVLRRVEVQHVANEVAGDAAGVVESKQLAVAVELPHVMGTYGHVELGQAVRILPNVVKVDRRRQDQGHVVGFGYLVNLVGLGKLGLYRFYRLRYFR